MTTAALPRGKGDRARTGTTVDVAGVAWPLYKAEAVVVGALAFLLVLALTQVLQTAVLTAAAAAVVVWWTRRIMLVHLGTDARIGARRPRTDWSAADRCR